MSSETSQNKALAIPCQNPLLFYLEMLQDRSKRESNRTLRRNSTAYNRGVLAPKYQSKESEKKNCQMSSVIYFKMNTKLFSVFQSMLPNELLKQVREIRGGKKISEAQL